MDARAMMMMCESDDDDEDEALRIWERDSSNEKKCVCVNAFQDRTCTRANYVSPKQMGLSCVLL